MIETVRTIEVRPTAAPLGAEIRCGDLRMLTEEAVQAIRRAWLEHLVVVFRDQTLTNADLVAFGRRFGEFQYSNPLPSPLAHEGKVKQGGRDEAHPEITVVSNIVEKGVAIGGFGDAELVWHSDMSSFEVPPNQTVLYALEVPQSGGSTGFANMYAAFDTLPVELKARARGLRLKHDHRHQDGTPDAVTMYGGDSPGAGTAGRQEFPVDAESVEMFRREGLDASVANTWAMEIEPDTRFLYELARPDGRLFQVEFDLSTPVAPPPPPWGDDKAG